MFKGTDRSLVKSTLLRVAHEVIFLNHTGQRQYTPLSGKAFFLSRLSQLNWVHKDLRKQCQVEALFEMASVRSGEPEQFSSPSLYSGYPGFFWSVIDTAQVLKKPLSWVLQQSRSSEEEFLALQKLLLRNVQAKDWLGRYELIQGLVGIGFFALKLHEQEPTALTKALLEAVIKALAKVAEHPKKNQVTWFTPANRIPRVPWSPVEKEGYYNLGMSHGIAGVIAFLAQALSTGLEKESVLPLLSGAVTWFQQIPTTEKKISRFPNYLRKGEVRTDTALSWCYGDPGTLAALILAAKSLKNPELEKTSFDLFEKRLAGPRKMDGFRDPGLCHGTVGAAMLSFWFCQFQERPSFQKFAQTWFLKTLTEQQPENFALGAFPAASARPPKKGGQTVFELGLDHSFLTGAPGVGLALLTALHPEVKSHWTWLGALGLRAPPVGKGGQKK